MVTRLGPVQLGGLDLWVIKLLLDLPRILVHLKIDRKHSRAGTRKLLTEALELGTSPLVLVGPPFLAWCMLMVVEELIFGLIRVLIEQCEETK